MNKLFEPVYFDRGPIFWDYRIRIEANYKGYYHWHQCCEFMLIHEGSGTVVLNQQTFEIRRGMFFFFQPFQLHQIYVDVSADCPYERSIFYADPLLIEQQLRAFPSRHKRFTDMWQSMNTSLAFDLDTRVNGMEQIFADYEHARLSGKGEEQEELMLLFVQMINLFPAVGSGSGKETLHAGRRPLRYSEKVMKWLEEHYREEVNLERLAEEMHLSPNYISRLFRQETGSSITDYLTARRIKHACRLLESTDKPVELIGIEVGFLNASYFIQLFKKVVGMTPLKYRFFKTLK